MRIYTWIAFVLLLCSWLLYSVVAIAGQESPTKSLLNGLDARKALEIANQWRWSEKEIKSYINTQEIVFKFRDGRITKIPLPENEVMIAVAPYIKNTHD